MPSPVDNSVCEVVFVGLPGPTHHYSGLSEDNVASGLNRGSISNPRLAALQALDLVQLLTSLGIHAAILPPQLRPYLPLLRQHFSGNDASVIMQASREAPTLLENATSSSSMWVANAATVSPAVDSTDGKLHLTAANLFTNVHRRIEAEDTYKVLKQIFSRVPDCVVHVPLSAVAGMRDEGAANHMRLSPDHASKGLHVFVYGADGRTHDPETARQSLSASRAVKQQHAIPDAQAMFVRQNPDVIRAGVFHNDVIAVSNGPVLLAHALAYDAQTRSIEDIAKQYETLTGQKMCAITIPESDLSVEEAVHTYFFNSQIVTRPDGGMSLIAPGEVRERYDGKAADIMERICAAPDNPIDEMHIIDLRQSMQNGGGPACLRLRVPVTEVQLQALQGSSRVMATQSLVDDVAQLVERLYPDHLAPSDIGNPDVYQNCREVITGLGKLMGLSLF